MAIWAGTTYNNTLLASATSQLHKSGMLQEQFINRNAFLRVLLDYQKDKLGANVGTYAFNHFKEARGKEIKVRIGGKDNQGAVLARGGAEIASSTPSIFDGFGAAAVRTAIYQKKQYIPGSEIEEIRGKEAETKSLVEEYLMTLTEGEINWLAAQIISANLPSASAVGGIRSMVSDGLTALERGGSGPDESAYNNYLLTRNDADNAFWRSLVKPIGSTLTLALLSGAQVEGERRGGKLSLGVANETHFGVLKQLVEALTHVTYDENMTKLGARYVHYSGTTFVPEALGSSTELFLLDPASFSLYRDKTTVPTGGLEEDPSRENAYFMKLRTYFQFVCDRPRSNVKVVIS